MAVEGAVLQGDAGCRLAAGGIARRWRQRESCAVKAQTVFRGVFDETFCIDRAGKMVVKIAAFWHLLQKGVQKQRLVADRLKISGSFLLSRSSRCRLFLRPGRGNTNCNKNSQQTE